MEKLPISGPAVEGIQMFAFIVAQTGLVSQFKMGLDNVFHVTQKGCGPLLTVFPFVHKKIKRLFIAHG